MEISQRGRGINGVQERSQFGQVRVVGLGVQLPDQRLTGPERAHQRVLTAHEIQIAGPQQVIEVLLSQQVKI